MTDYNNRGYNGVSDDPRTRHLDDIYANVDATYDYDSAEDEPYVPRRSNASSAGRTSGSASSGNRNRSSASSNRSSQSSRSAGSRSSQSARSGSNRTTASRQSRSSSDTSVRRSSSNAGRSRQASLNRKRKRKFRKLYLAYIAILVVILIVGAIVFSSYLSSYENGQPAHVAETIVKQYSSQQGIVDFVTANADKTSMTDNVDLVAQTYATNIAGKKISFKENNDFRPDSPSYDITADGSIVAKVTLASDGTGSFGSPKWKISGLNIADYLPDAMSVTVEAPSGSIVKVNGTELDSSKIVSSGVPEILANSIQYLAETPQYDTYKMSGLLSEPTVEVTDASGNHLDVTKSDDRFVANVPADQSFIDSVEPRVYDAIDNYATYFIHESFDLYNYIIYGSDLYTYIFGSDTMDPIATGFYMFEDIESYEFIERSASNYIKYADDCFTVDVKYALDMNFTDPTYEDNNQKMDATWVFAIEPLDGSWCISDVINH